MARTSPSFTYVVYTFTAGSRPSADGIFTNKVEAGAEMAKLILKYPTLRYGVSTLEDFLSDVYQAGVLAGEYSGRTASRD